MRYSILYTAPFVVAAYGASSATSTDTSVTVVPEISGSVTVESTYSYSNPATAYLTETNSAGVVTGEPTGNTASAVTSEPSLITSQPAVATIPNGLTSGLNTITQDVSGTKNVSGSLTSFTISVGKSTTAVLSPTTAAGSSGAAGSGTSGASATAGGNGGSGGSGSSSASASSSSSSGAAAPTNIPAMVGGSLLGLGALFAALV